MLPVLVPVLETGIGPFHPSEPVPPVAVQPEAPVVAHDSEAPWPT
jgi:hypothetical protein